MAQATSPSIQTPVSDRPAKSGGAVTEAPENGRRKTSSVFIGTLPYWRHATAMSSSRELVSRDRNSGVERKRASAAAVDEILTRKPEPSGNDGAG